jgi:alanine dehydrogenase
LGGLAAAERGRVAVIGAGSAGGNSARLAAALGAEVTVFDRKRSRLEAMRELGPNVTALYPYPESVEQAVISADLVIGAVLIPGARAPRVVSGQQVGMMQAGSVVVDISVDQGGCIETTRPTTYEAPTYVVGGVVHLAVTNMPGAVPRSASQALSAALTPFVMELADGGVRPSARLQRGINVKDGKICHPALRSAMASN